MDADAISQLLFPTTGSFSETEYLAFLAARVPADIAKQLDHDGGIELFLAEEINIDDLVRPLSSYKFPTDKLVDIIIVLESTLFGYSFAFEDRSPNLDPYKLIFVGSLYFHCGANFICRRSLHSNASHVRQYVQAPWDFETRIHVARFLGSLLRFLQRDNLDEYAPLSTTLITMSLILSSIVEQLSTLTEDAMKREDIRKAWEVPKEDPAPSERTVSDLKHCLSEMFGPHGKLRKSADRFLFALGSGEEISGNDDGG